MGVVMSDSGDVGVVMNGAGVVMNDVGVVMSDVGPTLWAWL